MTFIGPMSDISDTSHGLLEPPSPAYSNVTVRRAFAVWMHCGQRNKFKDVCNYFHHLEALEDQLSPEKRALSRHYEFDLFAHQPPVSTYLLDNFPQLYKDTICDRNHIVDEERMKGKERNDKVIFNIEGFSEITPKKGTTTKEILEASYMIRKYCKIQMVSLKKFLEEFKHHARKCQLKYTVVNVASYIKRKMVQAEIELESNYPRTLDFLTTCSVDDLISDAQDVTISKNEVKVGGTKTLRDDNNLNSVKILRKVDDNYSAVKKYWFNANEECFNKDELDSNKTDQSTSYNKTENMLLEDINLPTNESTGENCTMKKERRFSGSRFMKIDLEKFRKI